MTTIKAYGTESAEADLEQMEIERRDLLENDVKIDILYCGVCHSDIHAAKNDWENTTYPLVPGHEIVGRVVEVGSKVDNYKEGPTIYNVGTSLNTDGRTVSLDFSSLPASASVNSKVFINFV